MKIHGTDHLGKAIEIEISEEQWALINNGAVGPCSYTFQLKPGEAQSYSNSTFTSEIMPEVTIDIPMPAGISEPAQCGERGCLVHGEHGHGLVVRPSAHEECLKRIAALGRQLEFDRTKVASCLTEAQIVMRRYSWIIEGRGSYEWDDDRWHEEFVAAAKAFFTAIEPLAKIAADWSNCPMDAQKVAEARLDIEADNARLRTALTAVEWQEGEIYNYCPWCVANERNSHKPDCLRQVALGIKPKGD